MALKTQGYCVHITEQYETPRGVYWAGVIMCSGVPIGTCENKGDGGQTAITIPDADAHAQYAMAATMACPTSHEAPNRFAEKLADYADGHDQED